MRRTNFSDEAQPGLLHRCLALLLLALLLSWRWRLRGQRAMTAAVGRGRPVLAAYLHGRIIPLAAAAMRPGRGRYGTFSSPTRDGRLIADTAAAIGVTPVYGSPEHGGARALVRILRLLRQQSDLIMTVPIDGGSKGPRGRLKPGVVMLAEKSGGWIVPVASSARPALVLPTWDRLLLPLPFATVQLHFGRPIRVPPGCSAGARRLLQRRLVHLQRDCDRHARRPQIDLVAPPRRKKGAS